MNINFKSLKNQQVDNKILMNVIEVMYNFIKNEKFQNVIINEFVDNAVQDKKEFDIFSFELLHNPLSINDILIVTENGSAVITPSSIIELSDNVVKIKSLQVKNGTNFFVTYKY